MSVKKQLLLAVKVAGIWCLVATLMGCCINNTNWGGIFAIPQMIWFALGLVVLSEIMWPRNVKKSASYFFLTSLIGLFVMIMILNFIHIIPYSMDGMGDLFFVILILFGLGVTMVMGVLVGIGNITKKYMEEKNIDSKPLKTEIKWKHAKRSFFGWFMLILFIELLNLLSMEYNTFLNLFVLLVPACLLFASWLALKLTFYNKYINKGNEKTMALSLTIDFIVAFAVVFVYSLVEMDRMLGERLNEDTFMLYMGALLVADIILIFFTRKWLKSYIAEEEDEEKYI